MHLKFPLWFITRFYDLLVAACMKRLTIYIVNYIASTERRISWWKTTGVGAVDTMSSDSIDIRCAMYLLPLDIISTNPTPHIPYPMENNTTNDLNGKVCHAFSYIPVSHKWVQWSKRKDWFKRHFGWLRPTKIFFKEIKYVLRYFQYP